MFGIPRFPRIAWIIAIVAVVILAYMYTTGAFSAIDPNAPQMTISVIITRDDSVSAESVFDPSTTKISPAETIDVGVPFVSPDKTYNIDFSIGIVATPESPAITYMNGDMRFSGENQYGSPYKSLISSKTLVTREFSMVQAGVVKTVSMGGSYYDAKVRSATDPSPSNQSWGHDIDGSTFTIECNVFASGDPTIFGSTSVSIILRVGAGGNINVEVTNISASSIE